MNVLVEILFNNGIWTRTDRVAVLDSISLIGAEEEAKAHIYDMQGPRTEFIEVISETVEGRVFTVAMGV